MMDEEGLKKEGQKASRHLLRWIALGNTLQEAILKTRQSYGLPVLMSTIPFVDNQKLIELIKEEI